VNTLVYQEYAGRANDNRLSTSHIGLTELPVA